MGIQNLKTVIAWLKDYHDQVMQEEKTALECLAKQDFSGHREHFTEKAKLLALMAVSAEKVLSSLDQRLAKKISARLRRFSASASHGLSLNSLFYYTSLLYRDDHKVGEPDTLADFIKELEEQGVAF
ncbi:MAG: hypothetical protein IK079_02790 [Desulfovibrio sp.]|nr:hypothetical protein [Desulfovibrio sp.]